ELLGGDYSCKSVMYTVDFDEIVKLQHKEEWGKLDRLMADAAVRCQKAGADIIVLCTNTMHLCKDAIEKSISVPFLHIAHATAEAISLYGLTKVALLGTKFTMEKDFYKREIEENYDIKVIVPDSGDRDIIHGIIYQELIKGIISEESRDRFKVIINSLREQGAEGVILGCTEIPLLIREGDVDIPIFDTTKIHAYKAVDFAIKDN
nr:amino acid racemase [Bacteroidales bacterium]